MRLGEREGFNTVPKTRGSVTQFIDGIQGMECNWCTKPKTVPPLEQLQSTLHTYTPYKAHPSFSLSFSPFNQCK